MCLSVERDGHSKAMTYGCNIRYPQEFDNFVYLGVIIKTNRTNFFFLGKYKVCFQELFLKFDCFVSFKANFIEILEIR